MLVDKSKLSSLRGVYGETLVELGAENKDIVVLDADVSCSTQTCKFAKAYPERFFNIGIAEQDLIGTAAGLSVTGKIPFLSTFAVFATGRAWDQIRNGVCYPKLNVKIVGTHGGITVGEDGATHQALEDISIMRSIPNMTVLVPSDAREVRAAIKFAAEYQGPMYIRIPRGNCHDLYDESYSFDYPKAQVLTEGIDVTIVSNGETMYEAVKCAEKLAQNGILAEVINVPVVKPLDEETIIKSVRKTGAIAVIENHSIIGGLGSAIAECLSENHPTLIKRIGTCDTFGQSGKDTELFSEYGLTADKFINDIYKLIERKNGIND